MSKRLGKRSASTKLVSVRLTPGEYAAAEGRARRLRKNMTDYVRDLVQADLESEQAGVKGARR